MRQVIEQELGNFGRPPKLSLLLTSMYWREYRTEFHISLAYGISEPTICRTIKNIENVLIQQEKFHLPNRKAIQSMALEIICVDAAEHPVERPQKKQQHQYSGKKKCHAKKAQMPCGDEDGTNSFCRLLCRRQT